CWRSPASPTPTTTCRWKRSPTSSPASNGGCPTSGQRSRRLYGNCRATRSASPESCSATTAGSWPSSDPTTAAGYPPGGVLELSETPADGVAREVLEETGIHVKVDQLTSVYKNMVRGIVTLAFRCYATGGDTHPTSEARQVAWLTVDEAARDMV